MKPLLYLRYCTGSISEEMDVYFSQVLLKAKVKFYIYSLNPSHVNNFVTKNYILGIMIIAKSSEENFKEDMIQFNNICFNILDMKLQGLKGYDLANNVMDDLSTIEGFRLKEVSTVRGIPRVQSNLSDIMPWVARVIHAEMEEKLMMILKVEFELEQRLQSIGLDINGKPLQHE